MTDYPHDDHHHADTELARAAIKGAVRHALPNLWYIPVGVTLSAASWVLVAFGAARLGWWGLLAPAYFISASAPLWYRLPGIAREATHRTKQPPDIQRLRDEQDKTLARYRAFRAKPRWTSLGLKFWRSLGVFTIPKAAIAAYALTAWWPPPTAIAAAAVPIAWAFVKALKRDPRMDPVVSMLLERRGPEGLPTPEI